MILAYKLFYMSIVNKLKVAGLAVWGICFLAFPAWAQSSFGELLETIGDSSGYMETPDKDSFIVAIARIINVFLGILGVIFVVLIIYGGFMWMTAAGNNDKVEKAKKIISRSVIGVLIILTSYLVTWFVMSRLVEVADI